MNWGKVDRSHLRTNARKLCMMEIMMLAVCLHHFWFQTKILAVCFILHRVYIRSAFRHVRQWWIVELHGCSWSCTWTVWACFLSCYLPNYKGCNSETWLTQSLWCKFSFSFLFHSNYITWLWKWNTLKHGKYVVDTCVLSLCIWVHFV